ncbi:MAG: hypothetical protein KAX31_04880, partial [Thermoplasmata archaeon]|nr:hypothetical protein [Thermoplasmata archaeon]
MKFSGIVALAMALTLIFSSAGTVLAQDENDNELILRVAMQDDMKTTNPLVAGDVWTWNVLRFIYDGPMNEDPETEELIPYIAVGSANNSDDLDTIDWNDCTIGNFGFNPRDSWGRNSNIGEAIIFYDFEGVKWHDN